MTKYQSLALTLLTARSSSIVFLCPTFIAQSSKNRNLLLDRDREGPGLQDKQVSQVRCGYGLQVKEGVTGLVSRVHYDDDCDLVCAARPRRVEYIYEDK